MSCIKKIKIDDEIYEANLDFRIAIKCNEIAKDDTIDNYERMMGIICMVFGEKGYENTNHYQLLLKWYLNYLSCGRKVEEMDKEPDMDYQQDMHYIEASFMSDYGIDLENTEMNWEKFDTLINGLSDSEFGNCCVLNRIRNLRTLDLSKIKDAKEKDRLIKAKERVALKKNKIEKEVKLTKKQQQSVDEFYKELGF